MSSPLVPDADADPVVCSPAAVEAITAALTAGADPAADLPRQAVPWRPRPVPAHALRGSPR
jgi:hypothetical protein